MSAICSYEGGFEKCSQICAKNHLWTTETETTSAATECRNLGHLSCEQSPYVDETTIFGCLRLSLYTGLTGQNSGKKKNTTNLQIKRTSVTETAS